jgi:hypothetical protein
LRASLPEPLHLVENPRRQRERLGVHPHPCEDRFRRPVVAAPLEHPPVRRHRIGRPQDEVPVDLFQGTAKPGPVRRLFGEDEAGLCLSRDERHARSHQGYGVYCSARFLISTRLFGASDQQLDAVQQVRLLDRLPAEEPEDPAVVVDERRADAVPVQAERVLPDQPELLPRRVDRLHDRVRPVGALVDDPREAGAERRLLRLVVHRRRLRRDVLVDDAGMTDAEVVPAGTLVAARLVRRLHQQLIGQARRRSVERVRRPARHRRDVDPLERGAADRDRLAEDPASRSRRNPRGTGRPSGRSA